MLVAIVYNSNDKSNGVSHEAKLCFQLIPQVGAVIGWGGLELQDKTIIAATSKKLFIWQC